MFQGKYKTDLCKVTCKHVASEMNMSGNICKNSLPKYMHNVGQDIIAICKRCEHSQSSIYFKLNNLYGLTYTFVLMPALDCLIAADELDQIWKNL